MHFEVPKASSFKEFAGEYLMIVISILTALALEQGAQALHHRSVAHEAGANIDAEIRANIDAIKLARTHNKAGETKMAAIRNALLADIRSGVPDDILKKRLLNEYKDGFTLSIRTPTLRREAWEVAVANQAVSWMPAAASKRYSVIYAAMRDVQSNSTAGNSSFMDAPRVMDTMSNTQMGTADPREVYRMLNQIISSYQGINSNLAELQSDMENAAAATAVAPAG